MLLSLWMMGQFTLLTLVVAFGTTLPQSPAQALCFAAAGVLALVPLCAAVGSARRARLAPGATPSRPRAYRARVAEFSVAEDPGRPGQVLARAPSPVVHAAA